MTQGERMRHQALPEVGAQTSAGSSTEWRRIEGTKASRAHFHMRTAGQCLARVEAIPNKHALILILPG